MTEGAVSAYQDRPARTGPNDPGSAESSCAAVVVSAASLRPAPPPPLLLRSRCRWRRHRIHSSGSSSFCGCRAARAPASEVRPAAPRWAGRHRHWGAGAETAAEFRGHRMRRRPGRRVRPSPPPDFTRRPFNIHRECEGGGASGGHSPRLGPRGLLAQWVRGGRGDWPAGMDYSECGVELNRCGHTLWRG